MSEIKSLADQLREKIRTQETEHVLPKEKPISMDTKGTRAKTKKASPDVSEEKITMFFSDLETFELNGNEKSLIRLDSKTVNLLKRIKLAKGIDMNKFIVYSLHQYIGQHPWLAAYIQESLKNTEL